jgi:hypothetical protein
VCTETPGDSRCIVVHGKRWTCAATAAVTYMYSNMSICYVVCVSLSSLLLLATVAMGLRWDPSSLRRAGLFGVTLRPC